MHYTGTEYDKHIQCAYNNKMSTMNMGFNACIYNASLLLCIKIPERFLCNIWAQLFKINDIFS